MSALEDALLLRAATGFEFNGDGAVYHVIKNNHSECDWIIVRALDAEDPRLPRPAIAGDKDLEFTLGPAVIGESEKHGDSGRGWIPWHPVHGTPNRYGPIEYTDLSEACLQAIECSDGKDDLEDITARWETPWWTLDEDTEIPDNSGGRKVTL